MTANRADFPIATMSAALGVSRSGFYARRTRPPSARAVGDAALTEMIVAFHARSGGTYDASRIHADLAEAGVNVGRKRVVRLMRGSGIAGVSRRRFARTTVPDERVRPAADLVDRDFTAEGPDQLWVADITYIATWTGFLYLAVVLDTLNMAIGQRRPRDVIHHSDQGSQGGLNRFNLS